MRLPRWPIARARYTRDPTGVARPASTCWSTPAWAAADSRPRTSGRRPSGSRRKKRWNSKGPSRTSRQPKRPIRHRRANKSRCSGRCSAAWWNAACACASAMRPTAPRRSSSPKRNSTWSVAGPSCTVCAAGRRTATRCNCVLHFRSSAASSTSANDPRAGPSGTTGRTSARANRSWPRSPSVTATATAVPSRDAAKCWCADAVARSSARFQWTTSSWMSPPCCKRPPDCPRWARK